MTGIRYCPSCGSELEPISFFKFRCPKCGEWAITKITEYNRGYYK